MKVLLLYLALLLQGIPVQQGGTVTGVLRDSQGRGIAGVRIAAVARGDAIETAVNGVAMAGLAETDEQGRFTLENIPPGRYSIAAGRLDRQTYFPGTQSLADARILTIAPGSSVADINFALNDMSAGRSTTSSIRILSVTLGGGVSLQITAATIPVQILTASQERVPISANGKPVYVRLESAAVTTPAIPIDGSIVPIEGGSFVVPGPLTGDFRVVVEGLPQTYSVKSITFGTRNIMNGTFQLIPENFSTTTVFGLGSSTTTKTPPSGLTITIGASTSRTSSGVRVGGIIGGNSKSAVYISGRPGITFSDGSFEFRDVQPGTHVISTYNFAAPRATVVVVGDKDMDGIELKETALLPTDIGVPKDPASAGRYAPGTIVPLARITGTVLDGETNTRVSEAWLTIGSEPRSRPISINAEGHFETMLLLPGTYDLKLEVFAHSTTRQTVTIQDKNVTADLVTRPLK